MNKALAACVTALLLWTAACGVDGGSDGGSDGASQNGTGVPTLPEDPVATDATESTTAPEASTDVSSAPESSMEPSGHGVGPGMYIAPDGGVANGYDLRFEVSEDGSVLHSLEANVLESCDDTSTTQTVTVGPGLSWDIVDGRFSERFEEDLGGGTVYTTLEGSFSGTTATGTIRQETVVAGSVCDTYALEFTAELT